jgi:hypothetical protein
VCRTQSSICRECWPVPASTQCALLRQRSSAMEQQADNKTPAMPSGASNVVKRNYNIDCRTSCGRRSRCRRGARCTAWASATTRPACSSWATSCVSACASSSFLLVVQFFCRSVLLPVGHRDRSL